MRALPLIPAALACTLFLTACGGGSDPEADADEKPPSFILISLDTLRADHMSLYGYERATTPNLDALAAESVVYDRAISSSCWTLISHMSMLTGLYPEQHGVVTARHALSPEVPLIAERLKHEGYQTLGIYKQGWIHRRFGMSRGFDVFEKHKDAIEAGENLRAALDELDPAFPFFLFLHLFDIHSKELTAPDSPFYDPPAPWDSLYVPDARERLEGVVFTEIKEDSEERLTPEQLEALLGLYDGGITWVDSLLGEWLEDWRARGLLDDTLLIITADHGESLGQRNGGIQGHGGMYQNGLHVPFLVRYPDGRLAGERIETPISQVDIIPTALDFMGFEVDPRLPGYSLIRGAPEERVIRAAKPPITTRIQWPRKLISRPNSAQFFDLDADPLEIDPTYSGQTTLRPEELDEAFALEFADRPWMTWEPIPSGKAAAEQRAELDALGYAGEEED